MSIFKDVDGYMRRSRVAANHGLNRACRHLPRGTEVLFKFGNMVEVAPARVLYVGEFGGFIRVQVRNLRTGGKRNIPLDAIEKVYS